MIRGMTGFGEFERQTERGTISVQIRTLNHRHFHTHYRLPAGAERWESDLTQLLRQGISRGSVHVRIGFQVGPESQPAIAIDRERLHAYLTALEALKREHGLSGELDLSLITRFSDIFAAPPDEIETLSFDEVVSATREALDHVLALREREGEVLAADLLASLDEIASALDAIEERAPGRLVDERDRIRAAVAELADDVSVDEDRLAREIAFLAERWDLNEEVVRLRSHLDEFRELVRGEGSEPVGKRLSFWVQEMHRETNTIGSKANDAELASRVVDIKTAIEKLREQCENVE